MHRRLLAEIMPWQFAKFIRRPFQSLFYSSEYYYNQSKELHENVHAQDVSKPQELDQDLWMREKAVARASFIMGIAGLEAFANNVLRDFCARERDELPKEFLNKLQRSRPIDRWRLTDRVYFLPTLCNDELVPPAFYFRRDSTTFRLFEELVEIRNGIMHGRPEPFLALVKLKTNKLHEANDNIVDNFWPISQIPRDFSSFNHDCAKTAHDNIKWVRDSLIGFLDKVDEKYMREEKVKLVSPVIPDSKADEGELLRHWRKYVAEDER